MILVRRFTPFLFLFLLLTGCSDNATIIKYDKSLTHLDCLRLVVFPPDVLISTTLKKLYTFDDKCPYELQASRKSGIACNSNYNADKKALSNFPSGYIRLDIYKDRKLVYSYYKDLTCKVTRDIIEEAFEKVEDDLLK